MRCTRNAYNSLTFTDDTRRFHINDEKMSVLQSPVMIDMETLNENNNGCESSSMCDDAGKRRPYSQISVRDKLKYIKRLERGASAKVIAQELGLSPSTVRKWRYHRYEFEKVDDIVNRKRARMGANPRLDEAVYIWFQKQKAEGVTVSGTILKGKATEFNEKMGGDRSFNASNGWLRRWRNRHGINHGISEYEKLSISFEEKFSEILESKMNLTSSQVFNVAVTTLNYSKLPIKSKNPVRCGTSSTSPERVTIMTCSNVDSTMKLRLLVVGKSAQPRGLKNVKQLTIPVCYAHQEDATMNSQIFGEWFVNEFAPRVSQFLITKKMPNRALLVLDETDPISPDLAIGGIKTMLVPPEETLSVTTLKHKVTEDLKARYRQSLLESASDAQDKGHDPIYHVKMLGMKDIIFRLDNAWNEVSRQTIFDSWNNLLAPLVPIERDPLDINDQPEQCNVILNLLRKIAVDENITEEEFDIWMNDKNETLTRLANVETTEPIKSEVIEENENSESKNFDDNDVITPTQAVEALDSVITFFERHGRLSATELAALRKARDAAYAMQTKNS